MKQKIGVPNFRKLYPRLLNFGIGYGDLERVSRNATDWFSFSFAVADLGRYWERVAEDAWYSEDVETFQEHLRKAVDYYHYAQLRIEESPLKEELRRASRRCYKQLARLIAPPAVRYEIPFGEFLIPGYLRLSHPGAPCVILIGGLDSSKEVELHYFAEMFLRRSCSVFYFDGPGQGELSGQVALTVGFEKVISKVIDFLSSKTEVGPALMGCFGMAVGGYLACQVAASDPRIAACVCVGGFFDSCIVDKLSPLAKNTFSRAYGLEDVNQLKRLINLAPLRGQMKAPLLIVHGTADHLVDNSQIMALKNWACGPVDTMILEGSEHVCSDRFNVCLPRIGDWMKNWLIQKNITAAAATQAIAVQ